MDKKVSLFTNYTEKQHFEKMLSHTFNAPNSLKRMAFSTI